MHSLPKDLMLKIISHGGRDLCAKLHIAPSRFSNSFMRRMHDMLDPVIAEHPIPIAFGWYCRPSLKYTTTYDYWRGYLRGLYYEFIRKKVGPGRYSYHVFTPHGFKEVPGKQVLRYGLEGTGTPSLPFANPSLPRPSS